MHHNKNSKGSSLERVNRKKFPPVSWCTRNGVTMYDGIRVRRNGRPRSKLYEKLQAHNFRGELRR